MPEQNFDIDAGLPGELPCKTCGGTVTCGYRRPPGAVLELRAFCHGMWHVDICATEEDLSERVMGFLAASRRIPEKVPEYELADSDRRVEKRTEFPVSARTARAARLGAEMAIGGQRGRVSGIDTKGNRIWLET